MAAGTALIGLEPLALDQTMLVALATRTAEPIGPASLVQCSRTLLLRSVQPLELRQGEAFLELDGTERSELGHQELACYSSIRNLTALPPAPQEKQ